MSKYCFGSDYDNSEIIEAKNLETAISIFKTEYLFPEEYVDEQYIKKNNEGYLKTEYNDILSRYEYEFKDNPKIYVYEIKNSWHDIKEKKLKPVAKLTLEECVNWDYTSVLPKQQLLEHDKKSETSKSVIKIDTNGVKCSNLKQASKVELRNIEDLVKHKKHELQLKLDELHEIMNKMNEELSDRIKLIRILETYLGTREEIYLLKSGDNSPTDTPLYVYQQVLYMDEEVGIYEDGGLDIGSIEKFDKWIKKNYKKFLYKEKSVCIFQVRRKDKFYSDNLWYNNEMNIDNKKTYFLIRNGENLYRIWSDVYIHDVMFPFSDEYDKILEKVKKAYGSWGNNYLQEKMSEENKAFYEKYLYGFIAIQGIIDRTNILGYNLKNVKLLDSVFTDKEIVLIRDAEQRYWISDRQSWNDFIKDNQKDIGNGTRIVMKKELKQYRSRLSSQRAEMPEPKQIYIVEQYNKSEEKSWNGNSFKIMYVSDDTVYNYWDYHKRKNRISCKLWVSEVINFDTITYEDCLYYEKNRFERKNYLEVLPVINWIKGLKKEEEDLETEFKKLLKTRVDVTDDKMNKSIQWWKLKNKWKRGLNKDNKKAFKMIVNYLKGNKKYSYGEDIYGKG